MLPVAAMECFRRATQPSTVNPSVRVVCAQIQLVTGFVLPARSKAYVADFIAACPSVQSDAYIYTHTHTHTYLHASSKLGQCDLDHPPGVSSAPAHDPTAMHESLTFCVLGPAVRGLLLWRGAV
eukprot:SAG11_NODE_1417_length_4966_cov_4.590592_2_plen_124_part_00